MSAEAPVLPPSTPSAARVLVLGVLALGLAFVLYQVASGIALVVLLAAQGVGLAELLAVMQTGLVDYPYTALVANAVGQGVGLVGVAFGAARLTGPTVRDALSVRRPAPTALGVAALGALCLVPLVQALSDLNRLLPIPPWLAELEASQIALLEAVLARPGGWLFNLLLLAAVPAVCEEVLFRGWFQHYVGRVVSAGAAIALSGTLFGLFHLRPTQLLPLVLLGCYLAYVVWRTGSLFTGIVVHFLYNGLLVLVAPYIEGGVGSDGPAFPLWTVGLGLAGFVALMFWLQRRGGRTVSPVSVSTGAYPAAHSPQPQPHDG